MSVLAKMLLLMLLVLQHAVCSTITVNQSAESSTSGCTLARAVAALTTPDPNCMPDDPSPPTIISIAVPAIDLDGAPPTIVLTKSVLIQPSGGSIVDLRRTVASPAFSIGNGPTEVTLNHLKISQPVGAATTASGLISVDSTSSVHLTLLDCVFSSGNDGALPGAAAINFASPTGELTVTSCSFENFQSTMGAGGIATSSTTTITSSTFTNMVGSSAGVLLCENTECTLIDSVFNNASGLTGCVKATPVMTSIVTVDDCFFSFCQGGVAGGAISAGQVRLMRSNMFEDNEAVSGGAISAVDVMMKVANSEATFRRNTATGLGGAISSSTVDFDCNDCVLIFDLNKAKTGGGGAVFCTEAAHFRVASLVATTNTAVGGNGGFLSADSAIFDVSISATFEANTCDGGMEGGGAIHVHGSAVLQGTASYIAERNHALRTTPPFGDGGFLHASGVTISPTSIDFLTNTATGDGGAVFDTLAGSLATRITGVVDVLSNSAGGAGGAFRVTGGTSVEISGNLQDNVALGSAGGVLHNAGGDVVEFTAVCAAGCTISRNRAPNENGGVISQGGGTLFLTLTNYLVDDNSAFELGGFMACFGSLHLCLLNSDVENNRVTAGASMSFGGAFYVGSDLDCYSSGSFRGNSADSGGVFFVEGSPSFISVAGPEITGNSARLGSFYSDTTPGSSLVFTSTAALSISGHDAFVFQSLGVLIMNFSGGQVISGNQQFINSALGVNISATGTVVFSGNSFLGGSFITAPAGMASTMGDMEFVDNVGDYLFNGQVINVNTGAASIRDNSCGIAFSTGDIDIRTADISGNSPGSLALTSSPATIFVTASGSICSNAGTASIFQSGTADAVSVVAAGGIERNSGSSLFGTPIMCTLKGVVLRNNADVGSCTTSSSVVSPFSGTVAPATFEAGPGDTISATVTFPVTEAVTVLAEASIGFEISLGSVETLTSSDGVVDFFLEMSGPTGPAAITYAVKGICEGEPAIQAVQLITFVVPSATPSMSPTPTSTRTPSASSTASPSVTRSRSQTPSPSASATRSLSNSVQPIGSTITSNSASRTASSSRTAQLQPSQAAPPAPTSDSPVSSSVAQSSPSQSRTRSAVPTSTFSCSSGCVAPTTAPVTNGDTTVVITDGDGEAVGTVTVTEGDGDTVIVGPGDSAAEDALEEERIRVGSSVVEIFLFDPSGAPVQPTNSVEVCLKVEDKNRAEEEGCLSFFDEATGRWVCEDPCLDLDGDLACGDTDHLTNFAILFTGGAGSNGDLCGDDDENGFIFDEGWKDAVLVASVFVGFCLICVIIAAVSMLFPSVTARIHGKEYSRIKDLRSRTNSNTINSSV